jgi:hypothetical protein
VVFNSERIQYLVNGNWHGEVEISSSKEDIEERVANLNQPIPPEGLSQHPNYEKRRLEREKIHQRGATVLYTRDSSAQATLGGNYRVAITSLSEAFEIIKQNTKDIQKTAVKNYSKADKIAAAREQKIANIYSKNTNYHWKRKKK